MNVLKLNKTKTTKFIMPMIFKENIKHTDILTIRFINAYISDFDRPEYDNKILLVKTDKQTDKELVIEKPIEVYNSNETLIVEVYEIPENMEEDYYLIVAGKYSEISEDYKKKLLFFWGSNKDDELHSALYLEYDKAGVELKKNQKKFELYPAMEIGKEILNMF